MSLSILLPSSGRSTLQRLVVSVVPQLAPGDELMIDLGPGGCWGYPARERLTQKATGNHLLWNDDDDVYTDDALELVRAGIAQDPAAVHLFSMESWWGELLWREQTIFEGNVAAQMVVMPRELAQACSWGNEYAADCAYIEEAATLAPVVWHREVIVKCRP